MTPPPALPHRVARLGPWALVAALTAALPAAAEPASPPAAATREPRMKPHDQAQPELAPADQARQEQAEQRQKRLRDAGISDVTLVETVAFGPGGAERWRLANGLEVILAADPQAPVVAVHTWVKVGSADERSGLTGLAHLFEHLMFKGTQRHPPGTFDRLLEQHGASANAATWLDWTMYHQVVPPSQLGQVLELEADRLTGLALTPTALRAELEVVRNERLEVVDNSPDGQMDEAVWRAVFGDGPYGHPTLGLASDLAKITLGDARAFYQARYAPGNTALVLVGGLQPDAALQAVRQSHGSLPAREVPARASAAPTTRMSRVALELDSPSARLALVWRSVPLDHPDHPALALLAEVLAGADSTRLHQVLVDELRLASSVSCDQSDLRLAGAFEVRVALRPGQEAAAAEAAVHAQLALLLGDKPVSDAELTAAKNRMKTDELRELASVDGRADLLGHTWATAGSLQGHGQWWQRLAGLQVADVQRAAKHWLSAERLVSVTATPRRAEVSQARAAKRAELQR